jgi:hypothetical protein
MATKKIKKERLSALDEWLNRVEAHKMWEESIRHTGATITAYQINLTIVMVLRYANGDGWELFVPSSKSNKIVDTIDGAASFLGVEGYRAAKEPANVE